MKKKLLPICAMALLTVGYSSVASADTGTVTKEEAQVQQDKAKKKKQLRNSKRVMRRKSKQRKYKKKVIWLKRGSNKS